MVRSTARPEPRRDVARWRPRSAVVAVVGGLVFSQAIVALSLVVSDLILLAVVLAVAARGAERLGPATLGIRRAAFGPSLGWGLALLVLNFAFTGLLTLIFGAGGGREHAHHLAGGLAVMVTLAVAVTAPIAEEVTFRGFLFPALT